MADQHNQPEFSDRKPIEPSRAAVTNGRANRTASADVPQTMRRVGVIGEDDALAQSDGERIGAKLVIWGRLVAEGQSLHTYFQVLQAADLLDNPSFPQAIPSSNRALKSTVKLPYDPLVDDEKNLVISYDD